MKSARILSLFFVTVAFLVWLAGQAVAVVIDDNGFQIDVDWGQKSNNQLFAWGSVTGEQECQQVNITIRFSNRYNSSATAVIETFVENYKPGHQGSFKGADRVRAASPKTRGQWFVESASASCLK
jgi:hypothetical protein